MKPIDLPDVQSRLSPSQFKLTRVGVTGVKKLVHIKRPNKKSVPPLTVTLDLFVDLPASQKGSHMSRNLELVSEIIDQNLKTPVSDLKSFCAKTAEFLLKKHEYATISEVKAEADYFLDVLYPSGQKGIEHYKLIAEARAKSTGELKKLIGVKVIGMTACPCAQVISDQVIIERVISVQVITEHAFRSILHIDDLKNILYLHTLSILFLTFIVFFITFPISLLRAEPLDSPSAPLSLIPLSYTTP